MTLPCIRCRKRARWSRSRHDGHSLCLVCYAQGNHYADPEMMSFNQIGQALGFSGVTARNVFESAMRKLRDALDAAD